MKEKLKRLWDAIKALFGVTFIEPPHTKAQPYRDIEHANFLAVFVRKLVNLACADSAVQVETEGTTAETMVDLGEQLNEAKTEIAEKMLASGECVGVPAQRADGSYYISFIGRNQVDIVEQQGGQITDAFIELDSVTEKNKKYYLFRRHTLDPATGDLTVYFLVLDENGAKASHEKFADVNDTGVTYKEAGHIGFGMYKSPQSSRGLSDRGVPLNFGCEAIEKEIFQVLADIAEEFKNAKSKIFADSSILIKKQYDDKGNEVNKYDMPDGMFAIEKRSGTDGSLIDIFSPEIRYSAHYERLVMLFEQYENQVGTSKGILSKNETTTGATATEIRRSNADTLALIGSIRDAIDKGNRETLEAFNLIFNVPQDLYSYSADWFDLLADDDVAWARMKDALSLGVIEPYRLAQWLFPSMSVEEAQAEVASAMAAVGTSTDSALENALRA